VIAWVRRNGRQYGADPSVLFVAGSSAGANLAAIAALTPNDPHFRPGFERADTSVTAAVCLYGYYGHYPDGSPAVASSPAAYMHAGATPFFLAHGDRDTIVIVDDALAFAAHIRSQQRGAEQAAA
jgi:acetyl esterase/lipase